MVFNVVPTFFEVALVAGILAYKCGPAFAGLTAATLAAYTAFTFSITQARVMHACNRRRSCTTCANARQWRGEELALWQPRQLPAAALACCSSFSNARTLPPAALRLPGCPSRARSGARSSAAT